MKKLALLIAGAIGLFVAAALVLPGIFLIPFAWFESHRPSCNEDSPVVAYARSLSHERLARLYRDMEAYSSTRDGLFGWNLSDAAVKVPKEFSDLKVVWIRPSEGNIMVHGCFDHYVYMEFEGVGANKGSPKERRIILSWGERPPEAGEQVLWTDASKP
jgi:hypothetical protein